MAKRKTKSQPRQRKRTWRRFFSLLTSPPVRRLIAVIIVVVLLCLFWQELARWGVTTWQSLLIQFGAGLAIMALALGAVILAIWQPHFFSRRWNWWFGGIALALALWGLLAFFNPGGGIVSQASLGGNFGKGIIGSSNTIGALRIAGFIFLGALFIAPRGIWEAITRAAKSLTRAFRSIWQFLSQPSQAPPRVASKPAATTTEPEEKEIIIPYRAPAEMPITEAEPKFQASQPVITPGGWQLPPINTLDKATGPELSQADMDKRARLIEDSLASYGVETKVVQINVGPTVTQFGVEPGWDHKYKEIRERDKDGNIKVRTQEVSKTRVKVDRITSLANDLALALAAPAIRIEAPVPGKQVVGIEVPNITFGIVGLRSVIETNAFQKTIAKTKLALALGKGAGGETIAADLTRMPHLLIAGATGSGKTVCLNSTICCLLMHSTPDDVQFIMIDPKRVELVTFNTIPHLATPVIVDTNKAIMALRWLNREMDNRYRSFAQVGARNIDSYNKDRELGERLPYLVLIIDELADLMMTASDEVERTLCRLAQLSRATGIHLIVATQRPSVDVVTGLIKANFPTRISFAVTSQVDSRTILDATGAEKLLGRGDMLYMPTEANRPKRLQGSLVTDAEIERLVYFWGNQGKPETKPIEFDEVAQASVTAEDPLLTAARNLAQQHKHISTSFLQRRLHIGYPRAARLMDMLEEEGLAKTAQGKAENSKTETQ